MIRPTLPRVVRRLSALSLIGCVALSACRKDDAAAEKKKEAKAGEENAAGPTARTAPDRDEGIDVPTEEDFEEAVASQITPETDLQKELDQLEKEISEP